MIDEELLRGCATSKSLFIYLFIKQTKFGLIKISPVLAGASFHPKTRKVLNRKSNSSSRK